MTETAPAVGAVVACPDLRTLELAPLAPPIHDHVELCDACQLVVGFLASAEGCDRFEPLIAARVDDALGSAGGILLDEHLATCEACHAVADSLEPLDEGELAPLPRVDPTWYALGVEVGRGGMGRVLAARDLRVGRPVAVKELLGRSRQLAARFEREARVTARLQHPGIVPIYEIGRWPDGTPFYTMRMVDGRTLRDAIGAAGTVAARLALLPAVIAATEAIAFAHAQRIIHRDLTPSNVLVGAYGETVVIDWGLAKDLADTTAEDTYAGPYRAHGEMLTGVGTVIGTAAYMPPEQANAETVDERADVYALGAILYHLLAGNPPYRASRGDDLLREVRAGPPRPIEEIAPAAPRDLVSIVTKAMARDPAARYPSALELANELKRFQTGRVVEAHEYTTAERMRRFIARNRAPLLVTAIGLVVVGVLGGVALSRVYRERATATRTVTTLLEEKGRTELLAGSPARALAFLAEAYQRGDETPSLRFMLASSMREVDAVEATLDCGADVRRIDLSPDGTRLVAACKDVGKIWRLADHALVATLGPFVQGFDEIRFSHDGRSVISGGLDGYARVFDAATGELRRQLEHAPGTRVTWLGLTPDDRRLITTGFDGTAQLWDLATGERVYKLRAGTLGFVGVYGRLTPDGKTLITATLGGTGTGWDVATGKPLASLDHGSQILGGEVSPDSRMACTPGVDRRVKVWDLVARAEKATLPGHSDVVWKCVFSPDSTRLVTSGNDGTAKVWDLRTNALVTSVTAGDIVWSVAWSPDGQRIATSSLDGSLKVWEASTGALLSSHDDPFGGKAAVFSLDGKLLITQRGDGRIRIWREPGGPLRDELVPPAETKVLAASVDGSRAVLARGWGGIELWDIAAQARVPHEPLAEPFALAGDGRRLAARAGNGIAVIDTRDGRTIAKLPGAAPSELALDRNGARLLERSPDALRVWDVDAGRPIATLDGAHGLLGDDGRRALTWPHATVWDVDAGQRLAVLREVGDDARPVGFSRDGTRVALHRGGDTGRSLSVWRDTGELVFTDRVANDSARFDPSGTLLTTIGPDNVVKIRRVDDGAIVAQFVGEHLSRAQADADGRLVVAIDKLGAAVLVLGAADGLVLAQRPILHPVLSTSEDTFVLPDASAWWTGDSAAEKIVTVSGNVTVWDAHTEERPADTIVARAREHLPWHVRDGRLELMSGHVQGRVVRDGAPVAGASVSIAIREVPRLPAAMSWTTTMSQLYQRNVASDPDGEFELAGLLPGEYTLIARVPDTGSVSAALDLRVSDLESEAKLELGPGAMIAGVVADGEGRPRAGVRVVAACSTQPIDTGAATTDAGGKFEIGMLAGGCTYEVTAAEAQARVEVERGAQVESPRLQLR